MAQKNIVIKVEWIEEDEIYIATSDDLVGLIIQEETVDACCKTAQEFAYDMIEEYQKDAQKNVSIDFNIIDKAG